MRSQFYLFILLSCLIYPLTGFTQVDLNNGLVAYYPFDGNANDASGNGNNPISNNATLTTDVYGNPNSAYYFNGIDNYMEIPNSAGLNMGTTISICAWVKPAGFYYGPCHGNSVLMKGNSDFLPGNYMLRFDDAFYTGTNCNGGIPDTLHQTYYGMGTGLSPVQDTPYAQKNIWRSVVYTYDGLHAKLYIDCNLVLDTEQPGLSFTNGDDLFLGKLNDTQFPYWLNGVLDEVRIYNRALNPDEVKAYSYTCADKQPCSNWLKVNHDVSGFQIGDLDIPGDQITVEATFNRIMPYSGSQLYAGDLVSKHEGPATANYLLRPNSAEITTTNGYFKTPDICDIQLNKTYHVAMVYDGKTLKFYRNGFLMSSISCTGNLYQNDYITTIGSLAVDPGKTNENLVGYINQVRIWNVARTQSEIRTYMDKSLPNPSTQNGLLAYYVFDDLKNKQGNSQWDGSLLNDAFINQTNPNCDFIADSCSNTVCDLKADFTYRQNSCDPHKIQFHSTTLNADSIWWDFGNGKTAGNTGDTAIQYAVFNNYTVKLFAKTNAGCLDTAEYTVNVNVLRDSAIVNRDTSICAGNLIQLKGIKGLSYCWSPSAGLSNPSIQNPIASPSVSTKYYLHVLTDSSKPVIVDSVTITVIPAPAVDAGKDVSVCKGDSVQLSASGAVNYNWNASAYLSDTITATPVASPVKTASFIVKGYNAQGCTGTDTVEVVVLALPQIALTNDTAVCTGGSVSLQANSNGKNAYNWIPSTGLSNSGVYDPVASPVNPTKYFVKVTDENHCTAVDSVVVGVLPIPKVSTLNDTSACLNTSINLKTTASDATIFKWSPSTGLDDPGVQNPDALPATSTLYTVVAGNGICSDKDSVLVSVLSLPNVKAGNDTTVCGNASVQLNASGAISYVWSPSAGLSNATIADPVASPGTTTTYFVKGSGDNSCVNTDSVRMVVNPPAAFNITPPHASVCLGDSILLTASGGDSYSWSPTQGITNTLSASTKVYPARHATYSVAITNTVCKVTSVLTSDIVVKDLPVITVSKSNDIDCLNFEAQLQVIGGMNYNWYPSTYMSNTHISNPIVNPPSDTKYFVKATDVNGCSNKDSILILSNTNNSDKAKFEIASAFTPNHDGVNDCFSVHYWGPADFFDMSIYNRFGQLVYHSKSTSNCWDGTFNGQPQPGGTYIYVITASTRCSNGTLHKKGTLVLLR